MSDHNNPQDPDAEEIDLNDFVNSEYLQGLLEEDNNQPWWLNFDLGQQDADYTQEPWPISSQDQVTSSRSAAPETGRHSGTPTPGALFDQARASSEESDGSLPRRGPKTAEQTRELIHFELMGYRAELELERGRDTVDIKPILDLLEREARRDPDKYQQADNEDEDTFNTRRHQLTEDWKRRVFVSNPRVIANPRMSPNSGANTNTTIRATTSRTDKDDGADDSADGTIPSDAAILKGLIKTVPTNATLSNEVDETRRSLIGKLKQHCLSVGCKSGQAISKSEFAPIVTALDNLCIEHPEQLIRRTSGEEHEETPRNFGKRMSRLLKPYKDQVTSLQNSMAQGCGAGGADEPSNS